MLVGVLSDTHAFLDPRLLAAFIGVEAIIHAGDVCSQGVLDGLREVAPLYAVQGNNDAALGGLGLPLRLDVELAETRIHIVHQLVDARPAEGTRVIVSGHSHRYVNEWRGGVLYLNPGAAGRAGFHRLQTAALLHTDGKDVRAEIVELGPRQKLLRRRA